MGVHNVVKISQMHDGYYFLKLDLIATFGHNATVIFAVLRVQNGGPSWGSILGGPYWVKFQ
jgi:hypothetical protein